MDYAAEINRICMAIAELYQKQLKNDKAVASGRLYDSVKNITTNNADGRFELYFNLEHYWKYAPENNYNGIRFDDWLKSNGKHKAPPKSMVEAIRQWITDKGLNLNEYAVATKIMKNGWRNQPRQNLEKTMASFDFEMLVNELEEVLANKMIDENINKLLENL